MSRVYFHSPSTAAEAHAIARTAIAGVGGTVRILRNGDIGWQEVARYTDTGWRLSDHIEFARPD